ncbi:MAG: DUF5668 domain-containing protein [Acidobacteriia bacterium]|nr:DUF5668 domain-containing protein [Terriglobia bacterium]
MTYHDRPGPVGIIIGFAIIFLGVALFLDQTGMFGWQVRWSFWPIFLIVLGLARFSQPRPDGTRGGGWLMFIGGWLLLNEMHVLRIRDSWPLLIIALGVHTMWKAIVRPTPPAAPRADQQS